MIKTQIQLEEWQYKALKKESVHGQRSMSEIIRKALTEALAKSSGSLPLQEVAGKYEPQTMENLKAHDAAWVESIR